MFKADIETWMLEYGLDVCTVLEQGVKNGAKTVSALRYGRS